MVHYLLARFVSFFSGLPQLIVDLMRLSNTGAYFGSTESPIALISIFNSYAPFSILFFYEFVAILCVLLPAFLLGLVIHKGKTHLFKRSVSTSGKVLFVLGIIGLVSWMFWIVDCHIFDTWYGYSKDLFLKPNITGQGLRIGVIEGAIWIVLGAVLKHLDSDLPDESDTVVTDSDPEKKATEEPRTNSVQSDEADSKYICAKCGTITIGWRQVCPKCESEGKMLKFSPQIKDPIQRNAKKEVKPSPEEQNPSATASTVLRENHSTVRPVEDTGNQLQSNETVSQKRETEIVDIDSEPTEPRPDAESKEIVEKTPNKSPCTIHLQEKGLSPILRRAFLFIEDGEWKKADEYLERVLDEEPENAYAYLGKTLIEFQADSIEQLNNSPEAAINSRNYIKALRYSDDELREFLQSLGSKMNDSSGESTQSKSNAL